MRNLSLKTKISSWVLDVLYPKICIVCNKEGFSICPPCATLLEPLPFSLCPGCAKKTPEGIVDKSCRRNGVALSRFFTALPYKNIYVKSLIQQAKYPPHYAKTLLEDGTAILIQFLRRQKFDKLVLPHLKTQKIGAVTARDGHVFESLATDENKFSPVGSFANIIIIPVPLHQTKLRSRSFNQAECIARLISLEFSIPLVTSILIRNRATKSQTEVNPLSRKTNIQNAFRVQNPDALHGKIVILIDDVYTSGSTMNECARVLRLAGAKTIWGITLAR